MVYIHEYIEKDPTYVHMYNSIHAKYTQIMFVRMVCRACKTLVTNLKRTSHLALHNCTDRTNKHVYSVPYLCYICSRFCILSECTRMKR